MSYAVIFKPSAEKQLHQLPKQMQSRVVQKLAAVAANPRSPGATKLSGGLAIWRLRVGDYRIVYEIVEATRKLFVTIVAHRREVYRDL